MTVSFTKRPSSAELININSPDTARTAGAGGAERPCQKAGRSLGNSVRDSGTGNHWENMQLNNMLLNTETELSAWR